MVKKINGNLMILSVFLLTFYVSFSAMSGAKYLSTFITTLEDLASDGKKVAVAIGILFLIIFAAKALFGTDIAQFINMIYNNVFIIAVVGIVGTLLIAVGGATIDENIIKEIQKNSPSIEKNLEVYYES